MYVYVRYPRYSIEPSEFDSEEPEDLKFHIDLVSDNKRESTDLYIDELVEVIKKVEKNIIIKLPEYLSKFIDPIEKEWSGIEKTSEEDDEDYRTYYYIDKDENSKKDSWSVYDSLYRYKFKEENGKLHFIKCRADRVTSGPYDECSILARLLSKDEIPKRFFDVRYDSDDCNKWTYGELNGEILDYCIPTTKKAGREMYEKLLQDPNNNMDLFLSAERKRMRVFLSHSMSGLSEKKVDNIRKKAMEKVEEMYKDSGIKIEFIDNFLHEDAPINAGRLWHLGRSIQQMEDADAIYFCENHMFGKGCVIERMIAEMYHLKILNK